MTEKVYDVFLNKLLHFSHALEIKRFILIAFILSIYKDFFALEVHILGFGFSIYYDKRLKYELYWNNKIILDKAYKRYLK